MADNPTQKRIKALIKQAQQVSTSDPLRSRAYLEEALSLDPRNEQTNLWLAVASTGDERDYYLRRVQEINPNNRMVKFVDVLLEKAEESQQKELQRSLQKTPAKKNLKQLSKWLLVFDVIAVIVLVIVAMNAFRDGAPSTTVEDAPAAATLAADNDGTVETDPQTVDTPRSDPLFTEKNRNLLLIVGFSALSATLGWGVLQFLIRRQKD